MRCDSCPALLVEGYEYPEEYCFYGEDFGRELSDGSWGCDKRSVTKINRDMKQAEELNEPFIIKQMGDMADYFESLDNEKIKATNG